MPKSITYSDLHDDEVRLTDTQTGGQKGTKLTQLGALDPVALIEMARVAGVGANKYDAFNFLRGYKWSLSFNAGMRHALLFWSGEDIDEETRRYHAAMAAWHFHTLTAFVMRGIGTDDRPPRLATPDDLPDIDPHTGQVRTPSFVLHFPHA